MCSVCRSRTVVFRSAHEINSNLTNKIQSSWPLHRHHTKRGLHAAGNNGKTLALLKQADLTSNVSQFVKNLIM